MTLIGSNIYIDCYKGNTKKQYGSIFLLTHWHKDHLKGLSKTFNGTIYCSRITSHLLHHAYPNIKYIQIETNEFIPGINESIMVLDANHLPGSIMFFFPVRGILYTGDYRLSSEMNYCFEKIKQIKQIKQIYIDGTFHHPSIKFLSIEQSIALMRAFMNTIEGPIAIGIYHAGTCALLNQMNLKCSIHSSISEQLRETLFFMYPDLIVKHGKERVILINPSKADTDVNLNKHTVIVPSSLWYCCKGNMEFVNKVVKDKRGHWRINFTCHSDYYDNLRIISTFNVKNVDLINTSRFDLDCVTNKHKK